MLLVLASLFLLEQNINTIGRRNPKHGDCVSYMRLLSRFQLILSSKAKGDGQVTELKRRAKSLCDQKDLGKDERRGVEQAAKDTEERWTVVLQAADETQRYKTDCCPFLLRISFNLVINVVIQY